MGKHIWLIKYRYDGREHTSGYCSGNEGDEEVRGVEFVTRSYPDPDLRESEEGFAQDTSALDFSTKQCRVKDGSGYCNAIVLYKAVWARKVNKRKNMQFLIQQAERYIQEHAPS
jgi:hypothetical protein